MKKNRFWIAGIAAFLILLLVLLLQCSSDWLILSRQEPKDLMLTPTLTTLNYDDNGSIIGKTFTFDLPEIPETGENLFAYVVHQYAQVNLDDELVAVCSEPANPHLGRSPGCYWITIPLKDSDSGKTLTLSLENIYSTMRPRDPIVLLSSTSVFVRAFLRDSSFELILSIMSMTLGLFILIGTLVFPIEWNEKRQMLLLGAFGITVGSWRLFDLSLVAYVNPSLTQMNYFLSVLSFEMIPAFFFAFLYFKYDNRPVKSYAYISVFFMLEIISFLLLQLLKVADLRTTVELSILFALLASAYVSIRSLNAIRRRKLFELDYIHELFYLMLAASVLIDVGRYIHYGNSRYTPLFLCVTVIFLNLLCFNILRHIFERRKRAYAIEIELNQARSKLMLSQIQPHFLFNSLSVIRELCHTDPQRAEEATVLFSNFLRQNMSSLLSDKNVSFTEELEHTKNYLALEQLRFGEDLRTEYDIEAEDFFLPTLTLQPIVENAVRHGISKRIGGGKVSIRTREDKDAYEVVVYNDGALYEPAKTHDSDREHVGIANVRERLKQLCGGTLEISSDQENGTCVTIRLPKYYIRELIEKNT